MKKIIQYLTAIFNVLKGGLIFPKCSYIRKELVIKDHYGQNSIYNICFTAFPVSNYDGPEMSNIEIFLRSNNDNKFVDVLVRTTNFKRIDINFLTTIKKYKEYDLSFQFTHKYNRGIVEVKVEVCPSSHYNPSTLSYVLPVSKFGYVY